MIRLLIYFYYNTHWADRFLQYWFSEKFRVFTAINPAAAAPQDGQVDPIMNHPFQLNDEERADVVQSATFVVPK